MPNKRRPYSTREAGGLGPALCLEEGLRIADLHLAGSGVRGIAKNVGRSAATISRELRRGGPVAGVRGRGKYAPYAARQRAKTLDRQPKASKFNDLELASLVQARMSVKRSPEQISDNLATTFPDRAEMQASPESIHQALYVQGRGRLRADLHQHLRTGRAVRRPRQSTTGKSSGKILYMILISERPAEVADRAVPGHWESQCFCRAAKR